MLFTADGKDLVDTVYSANCGGHTENSEIVFKTALPYLKGGICEVGGGLTLLGYRKPTTRPRHRL